MARATPHPQSALTQGTTQMEAIVTVAEGTEHLSRGTVLPVQVLAGDGAVRG